MTEALHPDASFDSFLPQDSETLTDRASPGSSPASRLRGNVLRFEPEDRDRFCRGLGVHAGGVRELFPSPV